MRLFFSIDLCRADVLTKGLADYFDFVPQVEFDGLQGCTLSGRLAAL